MQIFLNLDFHAFCRFALLSPVNLFGSRHTDICVKLCHFKSVPFAIKHVDFFWIGCVPDLLAARVNMYGAGLCALTLAYERFILVCRPTEKDIRLSSRKRVRWYVTVTFVIFGSILADGFYRYWFGDWQCTKGSSCLRFGKIRSAETRSDIIEFLKKDAHLVKFVICIF